MTQAVAKYAAKKLLNKEMDKYKSKNVTDYDPFYETIETPKGKKKKVKKQIPAYIPAEDADILANARRRAYMLDVCLFNFCGIRFGWSAVIGLVPAVGDVLDGFFAWRLIEKMDKVQCGLDGIKSRMYLNLILDFLVGLIPFVGDLADAAMKCNSRNVRLLEKRLDAVYKPQQLIDDEDRKIREKKLKRRSAPATVYEDFDDDMDSRPPSYDSHHDDVRRPAPAYSSRRDRVPDEEMGLPRHDTHRSTRNQNPNRHGTRNGRR
ncbi:uncharacterized protein BDR25DRAFT_289555 [Lindgomyces ingoldianus]|uniref:Uncharacterized protein n=1 Tax=Lindgomyces ingoldianus TaxID=673940 RepID=A0ACB6QQ69_9PLEO|nr:uncharacterized protein BDR25DRAFT_289555 [Lindgomyces ingoldianus]KAF2468713.1 hypothetical protein BDR25DRAFT_289555 [Lindgomyces ingoldianus]